MVGNMIDSQRKQKKKALIDTVPKPAMTIDIERIPPMDTQANKRSERINPIAQLPAILPAINNPIPANESHSAASRGEMEPCSVT